MKQDMIAVVDLESGYGTEIVREIRALGTYSEILPHDAGEDVLSAYENIRGVILAGSPNRKLCGNEVMPSEAILALDVPRKAFNCPEYGYPAPFPSEAKERRDALSEFVRCVCGAKQSWTAESFIAERTEEIKEKTKGKKVLLGLSGGVDSSVTAALLARAAGDNLICVHVNHGLLRKGESEQVAEVFGKVLGSNLIVVDAAEEFLSKLAGVSDPERKRKIIGSEFISQFEKVAKTVPGAEYLAQGTIYPDILESGTGAGKVVKSHHNVGGLPEKLKLKLIEPLNTLFKDEVREVGKALGLPDALVYRQPFPGPGLGVRCLGAITADRLEAVRESDAVLRDEFEKNNLSRKVWQYFTCVPDFKSVGVKNGERYMGWAVIIRAVNSVDAMTASVAPLEFAVLNKISERILNEVDGVNRVLYDLSPKPVSTIEWE